MSTARGIACVVVLTAAACNQVFDLAPTTATTDPLADVDNDGVPDVSDNCPTLANDQTNADGDPFGDACDACPMTASATTHDEDRDTVGDECDLCPGSEDLGADQDGDGVGDLCDPDSRIATERVAFESFVAVPAGWQAGATTWAASDDSIAPAADLAMTDTGLRTTITTSTGSWASIAGYFAKTRWNPPDRFGLVATGTQTLSCVVTCMTAGAPCVATMELDATVHRSVFIPPRPAMRVAILVKDAGVATCVFEGFDSSFPQTVTVATSGMTIAVLASPRVRATYFEHLQQ